MAAVNDATTFAENTRGKGAHKRTYPCITSIRNSSRKVDPDSRKGLSDVQFFLLLSSVQLMYRGK
jgi:hypothetical protein